MSVLHRHREKLHRLLLGLPNYNIFPPYPWGEEDFAEVVSLVKTFVRLNMDLTEGDDPLRDWLDSYLFLQEGTVNRPLHRAPNEL